MQEKYEDKSSWDCEFFDALYITRKKVKSLHEAALGRMRQIYLTYQALDLVSQTEISFIFFFLFVMCNRSTTITS